MEAIKRGDYAVSKIIKKIDDIYSNEFYDVDVDHFWNTGEQRELKAHRIHAYPAKFPAFIFEKGIEYAARENFYPKMVADIFCGCGTVAFEAKRKEIDFWGCDINPVATMIARTKSINYNTRRITDFLNYILEKFSSDSCNENTYSDAPERLQYWYYEKEYNDLVHLKQAIEMTIPVRSSYRLFFYCAFSNILKSTSRWLTKSIKPQIDPYKVPANVVAAFSTQCHNMINAYEEVNLNNNSRTKIVTGNFLNQKIKSPKIDMIITSPPYVTSYEYADLHQLSSLWLNFTNDYRDLRAGSIGSLYHNINYDIKNGDLSKTGQHVVSELYKEDKRQARSVAKYFFDMQNVIKKCATILSDDGFLLMVIGDTEYKGVHIENAKHITELMCLNDFKEITITKRKISWKTLTPYRDSLGRFTTNLSSRRVYGEEFIVVGRKNIKQLGRCYLA